MSCPSGGSDRRFDARRVPASMSQFDVGFRTPMNSIAERASRHRGPYLGGGVAGAIDLPDCISSGRTAAARVIEQLVSQRHDPPLAASRV